MNLSMKIKNRINNTIGFTIAELIISVGTLAILGVLILLFFMSSKDVGLRTEDLDKSIYHTNNIIESIKLESWQEEPLNNFKVINIEKNNTILTSLIDENWNPTDEETEALFRANITLKEESLNINKSLYDVGIEIVRLKGYFRSNEKNPIIHTINTKLYIPTLTEEILQ